MIVVSVVVFLSHGSIFVVLIFGDKCSAYRRLNLVALTDALVGSRNRITTKEDMNAIDVDFMIGDGGFLPLAGLLSIDSYTISCV